MSNENVIAWLTSAWRGFVSDMKEGDVCKIAEKSRAKRPTPDEFIGIQGWERSCFRDIATELGGLVRAYALARARQMPPDCGCDLDIVLFSTAWQWRAVCDDSEMRLIWDSIRRIHLSSLAAEHLVDKPEFAFLVGWAGTVDWAVPYRKLYEASHGGTYQLRLLMTEVRAQDAVVRIVTGMDPDARCTWADTGFEEHHLVVAWPGRAIFDRYISPNCEKIYRSLQEFLVGSS